MIGQGKGLRLDEGLSKAVREVFGRLHEEGADIPRQQIDKLVPRCHTALSDLEVEHDEFDGTLTYIKYPFSDGERVSDSCNNKA